MDANDFVPLLLCKISNCLPEDPVETEQGDVYDKIALEAHLKCSGNTTVTFHRSKVLKLLIEKLLATGQVDERYVGAWAKNTKPFCNGQVLIDLDIADRGTKVIDTGSGNSLKDKHIAMLMNSAKRGDTKCMINLGEHYLAGEGGVEKDEKKGYEWFDRAAEDGDELGIARKADCLLMGIGVDRDYEGAYEALVMDGEESVHCCLRLWYYHSKGLHGFTRNETKANKALDRIQAIDPELTNDDIQNMKMELINLLSGDTFKIISVSQQDNISDNTNSRQDGISTTIDPYTTHDEQSKDSSFPKNFESGLHIEGGAGTVVTVKSQQDDISDITTPSTLSDEQSKGSSAKETVKPMMVIPESEEGSDIEERTRAAEVSTTQTVATASKQDSVTDAAVYKESGNPMEAGLNCDNSTRVTEASTMQSFSTGNMSSNNLSVKKCFDCNIEKTQQGFTASQWRKTKGTGRCVACVSQCVQWQTSNINSESLQTKACNSCKEKKKHADFTQNQWKRPIGFGRCRECVAKGPM